MSIAVLLCRSHTTKDKNRRRLNFKLIKDEKSRRYWIYYSWECRKRQEENLSIPCEARRSVGSLVTVECAVAGLSRSGHGE